MAQKILMKFYRKVRLQKQMFLKEDYHYLIPTKGDYPT